MSHVKWKRWGAGLALVLGSIGSGLMGVGCSQSSEPATTVPASPGASKPGEAGAAPNAKEANKVQEQDDAAARRK